jgi:hypothetical protein
MMRKRIREPGAARLALSCSIVAGDCSKAAVPPGSAPVSSNGAAERPAVTPSPQALIFITGSENKFFSVVNNPLRGALYV